MKLFGGREDNQEAKGHVYRMNEKLISIGDDYWIEDETGERAFYVDGKVLRIRNTLIFKDLRGGSVEILNLIHNNCITFLFIL